MKNIMPKRKTHKIYKLVYNGEVIYVGSTNKPLNSRLCEHKASYNRRTELRAPKWCYRMGDDYDNTNLEISLIENMGSFVTRLDRELRENHFIDEYGLSHQHKRWRNKAEKDKNYYEKNKDTINEKRNAKCTCQICGRDYQLRNKSTHLKSQYCVQKNAISI